MIAAARCESCSARAECTSVRNRAILPGSEGCFALRKGENCWTCRVVLACRAKDRWRAERSYPEIRAGDQLCAGLLGIPWDSELEISTLPTAPAGDQLSLW